MKKSLILFLFIFFLSFLFLSPKVQAKEFMSFYKTTYEFDELGQAIITQEISLVNQTADLYVSEYALSTVGSDIFGIEAYDKEGPLKIETTKKEKTTIISLKFNEKAVGKGKVLSFILKYKTKDLVKKEGNLWRIAIPKLANASDIDEYKLLLKIPTKFGKLAFINPSPKEEEINDNFTNLIFSKDDIARFGVIASFGQYQTFNFEIKYDLENNNSVKTIKKVPIPPDTGYQTVYYENLYPEPEDIEIDEDGNWLALYSMEPGEILNIIARGKVKIFSKPENILLSQKIDLTNDYLDQKEFWPADDPKIKEIAESLKTPEKIYKYVVDKLNYNYDSIKNRQKRKGAILALKDPEKSLCTEFSDLFVTLSRAAGIPARELQGFAYTDNQQLLGLSIEDDLLHSWAEYFDKERKEWVMVDPAWGDTTGGMDFFSKFDMSHFVFVIHGKSDQFPLTPGSYKTPYSPKKQIMVSLTRDENFSDKKIFGLEGFAPLSVFSEKNSLINVELKNLSGFSLYNEIVRISGDGSETSFTVPIAPPFSKFKISFSLKPKEQMRDYIMNLYISSEETNLPLEIKVKSLLLRIGIFGGVIFVVLLTICLFGLKKQKQIIN